MVAAAVRLQSRLRLPRYLTSRIFRSRAMQCARYSSASRPSRLRRMRLPRAPSRLWLRLNRWSRRLLLLVLRIQLRVRLRLHPPRLRLFPLRPPLRWLRLPCQRLRLHLPRLRRGALFRCRIRARGSLLLRLRRLPPSRAVCLPGRSWQRLDPGRPLRLYRLPRVCWARHPGRLLLSLLLLRARPLPRFLRLRRQQRWHR